MARVLVVDDEDDVRDVLGVILEADGHQVLQAVDGLHALRLIADKCPDVVVLDVRMPRLNGIEVLRALRMAPATKDLPVVMVTVCGKPDERQTALALGVVDYINKPWAAGEVELRVKWALKRVGKTPTLPSKRSRSEGTLSKRGPSGQGMTGTPGQAPRARGTPSSRAE